MRALELTGMRFGKLLVIARVENSGDNRSMWLCQCDCGNEHKARGKLLKDGHTKSCGCMKYSGLERYKTTHGHSPRSGQSRTYKSWAKMRERCNNPNSKGYEYYGDRGITVDPKWDKFENFLHDMGECPDNLELDRIDNNEGYEPGNCRWADEQTQSENRLNVRWVQANGKTVTLKGASRQLGLNYPTLLRLVAQGLSAQQAVDRLVEKKK